MFWVVAVEVLIDIVQLLLLVAVGFIVVGFVVWIVTSAGKLITNTYIRQALAVLVSFLALWFMTTAIIWWVHYS